MIRRSIRKLLSFSTSPKTIQKIGAALLGFKSEQDTRPNLSRVRNVLIIRLDEIGDVVLTTPFLRELRQNLPEAQITLLIKPGVVNLVELCPYVNKIRSVDLRYSCGNITFIGKWLIQSLLHKYLAGENYDLAIIPRFDVDYYYGTFLAYFSGARWRLGYSEEVTPEKKLLNSEFDVLLTHSVKRSSHDHEVNRNLDLIRFLGGSIQSNKLELWINEEDEKAVDSMLLDDFDSRELLIAFCLGAGQQKRIWPIERFIGVAQWIRKTYFAKIVVIGGEGEALLGQKLRDAVGENFVMNLAGRTTLREAAALLRRCDLYVGNDTGPMHIAAAVGTPVVAIFCHPLNGDPSHPNSPARFGPWGVDNRVIQPPVPMVPCVNACVKHEPHCILNVSVGQVCDAIAALLDTILEDRNSRDVADDGIGRCITVDV